MYTLCMSIEDIKKSIEEKLKFAPSLDAKFKFDMGDDGALVVDGTQNPPVVSESDEDADTTFVCSVELVKKLMAGQQDPTMAFMTGQLKVQGSMGHALKLASLLED